MGKHTENSVTKNLCKTINEVMDRGSWDDTPSAYKLPGIFYEIDKNNKNQITIFDYDETKGKVPIFKITIEKI